MNNTLSLSDLLSNTNDDNGQNSLFAIVSLGIIECLANGTLGSEEAMQYFFNAANCLYVRKTLSDKSADEIMSHGVQLQDLFEALPYSEAQKEFQKELATLRSLCVQMLEKHRLVA